MRVVFMGTPDFAVPTLAAIVGQGHEVAAVYTRAPAAAGRGMALRPSPVQGMAERFGIPVLTPKSLRAEDAAETFRGHRADVAVVVAYGMLLPRAILEAPRLGCLNLHASLLPRWRGAAPIQWALAEGDAETGVTIMRMDAGLDTGDILLQRALAVAEDDTSGTLHDRLAALGAGALVEALPLLEAGKLIPVRQDAGEATHARIIEKEDGRLDFARPAAELAARVRAVTPWPGAVTT
ncbi:MAG: methionyl-tRNA formyltransferase, partial [Microvirga sp.]